MFIVYFYFSDNGDVVTFSLITKIPSRLTNDFCNNLAQVKKNIFIYSNRHCRGPETIETKMTEIGRPITFGNMI